MNGGGRYQFHVSALEILLKMTKEKQVVLQKKVFIDGKEYRQYSYDGTTVVTKMKYSTLKKRLQERFNEVLEIK